MGHTNFNFEFELMLATKDAISSLLFGAPVGILDEIFHDDDVLRSAMERVEDFYFMSTMLPELDVDEIYAQPNFTDLLLQAKSLRLQRNHLDSLSSFID